MAAIVLALVALPLWFPWLLRPVLNHYGLRYGAYERTSYSRFALKDVDAQWGGTRLTAKRFDCVLPTTWVVKKLNGATNAAPFFVLREGELLVQASGESKDESSGGFDKTLDEVVDAAEILDRFSPIAELTNCRIVIQTNLVLLPRAEWRAHKLNAIAQLPDRDGEGLLAGDFSDSRTPGIAATWNAYGLEAHVNFTNAAAGWMAGGSAAWFSNRATFTAQFPTNGWWPSQGRIESAQLTIPAEQLRLRGYEDLTAAVAVTLVSNRFDIEMSGALRPESVFAANGFPEGKFELAASGDTESVSVREFWIEAPWLRAELASAIGVTWRGELMAQPAQFRVVADLAKLPGVTMTGHVEGQARVEPWAKQTPTLQFQLAVTNLNISKIDAENLKVAGAFAFPQLSITELSADLADNSKFSGRGSIDVQRRELRQASWNFSGGFLNRFLSGAKYDELTASGEVDGTLTNLTHHSQINIGGFRVTGFKPMDANVRVRGQDLRLGSIVAKLSASEAAIAVEGAADLSRAKQQHITATLTNISFHRGERPWLQSQRPCELAFQGGTNWTLSVSSLDLAGEARRLSVAGDVSWPERGHLKVAITNLALAEFSNFWVHSVTNVGVTTFAADANWNNGPVTGSVAAAATLTNQNGQSFSLQADVAAGEVLAVRQLRVQTGYVPTLSVTGSIPAKIIPGRSPGWLAWNAEQRMELVGTWEDSQLRDFSVPLRPGAGFTINRPELQFQVRGTPESPEGSLNLSAHRISWQSTSNQLTLPPLEDFLMRVELRPGGIELVRLTGTLDGQRVEARGTFPLNETDWKKVWEERKLPDWSPAYGQLELERAQLSALAKYLPRIITAEGQLSARLQLKPGKHLDGLLSLTNVSTYPLGSIAPIRDIGAVLRFDGSRATLEGFHGRIGGQPVSAEGFVTVPNGRLKDYEVKLHGTNIPLARSPELLLRGNFDVVLRGESNAPPLLAGKVTLHNGLFVQHASARIWSRPKRPGLRPPYFSVTNEPVASWKMDLTVAGDKFLRVRTPLFSGLLSANLQLRGTLSEPVLTGDLRTDSGQIVFPFGGLEVNQGYASFSGVDPQGPTLQINASGRNYRYEIGLEVKGPAEIAAVTFTSTPPLTSEQILLMLTAGQLPQTEFSFSTTSRAGQVATFLGKDLYSQVFGSSRGEDRLIIRSGEDISEEGQVTYSVEYRLTDRWSIIGEYDQYSQFNADLKWRIYSR
ncbi:MAG TPA: translocation/assembly module TamB domain-containing protein [Verrucomicrobiae bacterium]|nr:translocation/assembly module TamB domain-containing protein [Verrucomicrobiae bacterium]